MMPNKYGSFALVVFLFFTVQYSNALGSGAPNKCAAALMGTNEKQAERLAIGVARSTEDILDLLSENNKTSDEWITIELVQDQSQLEKAPPFPAFALTFLAKKAFSKKIRPLIDSERPDNDLPKLTKMYFSKKPDEFRGIATTLTAHINVKLKARDLSTVITSFVEVMYHPVLGNKVFKISRLE